MHTDSDSDDGSDVNEEDNAYDTNSDVDVQDDEEFRSNTEAPDLPQCARGPLGEYLKALQWNFEVITEQNMPTLQSH